MKSLRKEYEQKQLLKSLENSDLLYMPWLTSAAEELNKRYSTLRDDIKKNTWTESQYCERLANHYFSIAFYYTHELFSTYKIDLNSIEKFYKKSLENYEKLSTTDWQPTITAVKYYLGEVSKTYKDLKEECKLNEIINEKNILKCIVIGNITDNQFILQHINKCNDIDRNRLNEQIQSIQLLTLINELEDEISVPEYHNTPETYYDLGKTYQLAGLSSLSEWYMITAQDHYKDCINLEVQECDDKKLEIKTIIIKEIEGKSSSVQQVKDYIEKKFSTELSSIDHDYIERKYIEHCLVICLKEIEEKLNKIIINKSKSVIISVFNSINNIQNLCEFSETFSHLKYYKLLIEHKQLLTKDAEKSIVNKFKTECLRQVVATIESAKIELNFLESFVKFLNFSKYLQRIIKNLTLEDFCHNRLQFDEFLPKIMNLTSRIPDENLKNLQEITKCLQNKNELFFIDKLKEVLGEYIKPIEIIERTIGNRLVIEVIRTHVIISEHLKCIEDKLLKNSNIEEVRFICSNVLHIDADFKNQIWHGKNIVIFTKIIKIHDKATWNISGKDNDHVYLSIADTGIDGADGHAGESGGNVLILTEELICPENFTIISNGGNGGKGQDGGKGKDGEDGYGISDEEFKEKFPSFFTDWQIKHVKNLETTIQNINDNTISIKTLWYKSYNILGNKVTVKSNSTDMTELSNYWKNASVGDYFGELVTNQGNELIFYFCASNSLFRNRQGFLLYKGTSGKPGQSGGEYGLGGQGGYSGEIVVRNQKSGQKFDINKITKQGKEGDKGHGGFNGKDGKNGRDMGYVDFWTWTQTIYRLNGKYKIQYFENDNDPSDRVWCSYKEKFAGIGYDKTVASIIQTNKRNDTHSNDRKHTEQVSRKKNVLEDNILTNYSNHFNSLQNLQGSLKITTEQALQTITENSEYYENQNSEIEIKRQNNFFCLNKIKHNDIIIATSNTSETYNVEKLIDEIENTHDWFKLKEIEMNLSQLKKLIIIFKDFTKIDISTAQDVKILLTDKYRLATLEEIAKLLPIYYNVTDNLTSTPKTERNYLIEVNESNNSTFCSALEEIDENLKKEQHKDSSDNNHVQNESTQCCDDILEEKSENELLADELGVNIRIYAEDENNKLYLFKNYNPESKRVKKYIQLKLSEDYVRLQDEYLKKDKIYGQILSEIYSIKEEQDFDDYLKKETFLSLKSNEEFDKTFYNKNNKVDIKHILEYFLDDEKNQLKNRLEKITYDCIGQHGILHCLLKRFSSEGRHLSTEELYYLINLILISSIEDRNDYNTYCWIISAYPQTNWIDELILLQLEYYFKKTLTEKLKWREYLSKIENKFILLLFGQQLDQCEDDSSISTGCIQNILYLLSNIPNTNVSLEGLSLSDWTYALKEKYWTSKLSSLVDWKMDDLSTASYYVLSMENIFGIELVEKFLKILEEKKQKLPAKNFIENLSSEKLTEVFFNFYNEKWNLSEKELNILKNCRNIRVWEIYLQKRFNDALHGRNITQLVKLIKGNANTSLGILDKLSEIEESITKKHANNFNELNILKWVEQFKESFSNSTEKKEYGRNKFNEMLDIIDAAIEIKRGYKLRDTQKLSVLALLTNNRNTLAQVSTGEGKTLIVVAASIMKALCGEKVDITTSSSVLAKRDADDNKDIYNLFGINVSHNCSEDIEKRKEAYSGNQVVYGDLSNFQRDYLLDKFYGKNILGDRNFENVIVDEVDSMLLDKGNNMLYLSYDLPGLDKLESIYIYIWQWINRPARSYEEISCALSTNEIKEAVLNNLYGVIKTEDIGNIDSELSEQQKNIIWKRLLEANILDNHGKILIKFVENDKLDKILKPEFGHYKDRIYFLLRSCIEREIILNAPNYLKSFIEDHLESWINSAKRAYFMQSGHDYVVDVDRTGTSSDRNPNITILDRDTGTDQANTQWDEALHQFLQLKHGCKLSSHSLKSVFISNVSFFQLYKHLYGLTGTLGSHIERNLLQEVHEVDFVTIPTAMSKQFCIDKPIICCDKNEWINKILIETEKLIEKRSVLIICETVNDVQNLHKAFGGKNTKHVHTYKRDFEEFKIGQSNNKLHQGQIIIATNLAGRGTDIIITKELKENGGLHVCLTYLPDNIRIEKQAFGRAARSGDKGSAQLIIVDKHLQHELGVSKFFYLINERDAAELHRVSHIKTFYKTNILTEENCFKKFEEQYKKLKCMLSDSRDLTDLIKEKKVETELKEMLLQCCLDRWAFWLDRNTRQIKNITEGKSQRVLDESLNKFLYELHNLQANSVEGLLHWVEGNPFYMVKLGKYLLKNRKYAAINIFDQVIKNEPFFSEIAHYYKAFILGKLINWEKKPVKKEHKKKFKKELREAAKLFNKHKEFHLLSSGIIEKIKKNDDKSIIQIDAYEEQKKSLVNLYDTFLRSIDDILGYNVIPQMFVNDHINEELSEILYEDLLREGILRKRRVKRNISEEDLKLTSHEYGLSVESLKNFLSLYEGKEIDENEFSKELKHKIQLPCRNIFWKSLIEQKILNNEVKYVLVDKDILQKVLPSLSGFDLEKKTIKCNKEQILLYTNEEQIEKKNIDIFEKYDFKTKYKVAYPKLKKLGIFSFNSIANIETHKIKSANFSSFDSISLKDFTQVGITQNEAEQILVQLVEQKVLEKEDDSENYRLIINFNDIGQIKFSPCQVYEHTVKGLLSFCFTYRIAVENLSRQLEENNFPLRIRLFTKPHRNLIWALSDQRIIKPIRVLKKIENINEKLTSMYSSKMSKDSITLMLSQHSTVPLKVNLFDDLVKEGWITDLFKEYDEHTAIFLKTIINSTLGSTSEYFIISSGERNRLRNYSEEDNKDIGRILNNRLELAKEETIKNIVQTLERYQCVFYTLEVPDFKQKPLADFFKNGKFENIQELQTFYLNGLDELLEFEEKKWTRKMLINTAIIIAMGTIQIIIGTAIKLYSVGILINVGSALCSEGVSDFFYAFSCLKSGYFSWNDYGKYKLESLMISVITVGMGAYFSKGNKMLSFGNKIGGPNFEAGKKFSEMAFKKLGRTLGKEFTKIVIPKILKGIALGAMDVGVDILIEKYLQSLCESVSSQILSNIKHDVDQHNISKTLEEAYNILGESSAKKLINKLTEDSFKQKSYEEKFILNIAKKVVNLLTDKLAQVVKNKNMTSSSDLNKIFNHINEIIVWSKRIHNLYEIGTVTNNFLNELNQKIKSNLNNKSEINTKCSDNDKKNYEKFKNEIIDQWKSQLTKRTEGLIVQYIVSPVLKSGVNLLGKYIGEKLVEMYQCYKENKNWECFDALKKQYQNELKNLNEDEQNNKTSQIKNNITNKYHENLLNLLSKTKDNKLFAAIIKENVPMDLTCVMACPEIISKVLDKLGIPHKGVTINVEGQSGFRQKCSSREDEKDAIDIDIEVTKDNHFQVTGSDTVESTTDDQSKNNCLYDALLKRVPELSNMTAQQFRNEVANCIENNSEIQRHIQNSWHKIPLKLGAYGGKHFYKKVTPADEFKKLLEDEEILFSQDSISAQTKDETPLDILMDDMKKNGFKEECAITSIIIEGKPVLLHNRRPAAAGATNSPDLKVHEKRYGEEDSFSTEEDKRLYKSPKKLFEKRIKEGKQPKDYTGTPASKVKIRPKHYDKMSDEGKKDFSFLGSALPKKKTPTENSKKETLPPETSNHHSRTSKKKPPPAKTSKKNS